MWLSSLYIVFQFHQFIFVITIQKIDHENTILKSTSFVILSYISIDWGKKPIPSFFCIILNINSFFCEYEIKQKRFYDKSLVWNEFDKMVKLLAIPNYSKSKSHLNISKQKRDYYHLWRKKNEFCFKKNDSTKNGKRTTKLCFPN